MSVRFFYVDESHDDEFFCLSAISIRHAEWQQCFTEVKNHRRRLHDDFGVKLSKEMHAHELIGGRGRISDTTIGKWQRSRIFSGLLQLVSRLPNVMLFNVCLKKSSHRDPHMIAWERLINRIERCMVSFEDKELPFRRTLADRTRGKLVVPDCDAIDLRLNAYRARAFIIADEGKESLITGALRRMHVHNPIPSRYGAWSTGNPTRNIITERIIEDPFFKKSQRSYFIQLADCVAFALLKRETTKTERIKKYGIDKMFEKNLSGVCHKKASGSDPLGIVR
jgi:hypothetical protein